MSSLQQGCKFYYNLQGNANDISGNSNDSTSSANVSYSLANGKIQQGGGFNGSSSRIQRTTANGLSTGNVPLSMSCWVKSSSIGAVPCIFVYATTNIGGDCSFAFGSFGGNTFWLGTFATGVNSGVVINNNTWAHAVVTYTGPPSNTIRVYVNNILRNTIVRTMNFSNRNVEIGYLNNGQFWNGQIDECAIWNRQLSVNEIAELWNNGNGLTYPFGNNASLLFNLL